MSGRQQHQHYSYPGLTRVAVKIVDDRSHHGGQVKVNIHPHALARIKERGCTRADVEYTVKHGLSSRA